MSPEPNLPEPPPLPARKRSGPSTALVAKEEQLAQAASMMAGRLWGHKSITQVANDHGVSKATAERRLRLARREGIPEMARNILIRDALPAALAVVLDSLKSSDEAIRTKSAWKLLDGLEAMKLPEEERAAKKLGVAEEDSYEIWRERVKVTRGAVERADQSIRREALPAGVAATDADAGRDIIEAVPLRADLADGPPAASAEDSTGDSEADDE